MVIKKGKREVYLVIFLKSLLVKQKDILSVLTISLKNLFWRPLRGWLLKIKNSRTVLKFFILKHLDPVAIFNVCRSRDSHKGTCGVRGLIKCSSKHLRMDPASPAPTPRIRTLWYPLPQIVKPHEVKNPFFSWIRQSRWYVRQFLFRQFFQFISTIQERVVLGAFLCRLG